MRIFVLSSSSSGNSTVLEVGGKYLLLDAGVNECRMDVFGRIHDFKVPKLSGILITHEHTDHMAGLLSMVREYNPNIYMARTVLNTYKRKFMERVSKEKYIPFDIEKEFKIDDISVFPFHTSHDTIDPCGFKITCQKKSIVYITDTGVFEPRDDLKNADFYILESNHDLYMLDHSRRPKILKDRIKSEYGHLSNEQSAKLASLLIGERTKGIILFHLSEQCNKSELALAEYKKLGIDKLVKLYVALKDNPLAPIEI